ncbi:hypothetical protein FQN49_007109 [Arthroderma sp. PD_2]|nr:hypothetical protein FQN49_007109 [Arthroderma sp. PD_2]
MVTWNEAADAKLLFAILKTTQAKIDYAAVAEIIGNDCTPIAIQRRLAKIKSKAAATTGSGGNSSPATPKRASKATKRKALGEGDRENDTPKKPCK